MTTPEETSVHGLVASEPAMAGQSISQWILIGLSVALFILIVARFLVPQKIFSLYLIVARVTQHKGVRSFAAILTVLVGGYYTVKKAFGWSLSVALDSVFHSSVASHVSFFLLWIVIAAVIVNAFNIWFEHNPPESVQKIEPDGIAKCILHINNELEKHVGKIHLDDALIRTRFSDNHSFEENIALIVSSLGDHAVASIKGIKTRRRDIFISVYKTPNFKDQKSPRDELVYVTHYPPNRDNVGTKRIRLDDNAYKDFACVRCVREGQEFICSLTCNDYARGSGKRSKTVKHFFGFAIKAENRLLGFVNIEFHNERFFADQSQLELYAENHLIVFKYLITYQFLKAILYHELESRLPMRPRKAFSPQTS